MAGFCQEVLLQMALRSALEKGVALLIATPLHVGTVPHLQSIHLVDPSVMVEDLMKEIVTGIQATKVILNAHQEHIMEMHEERGVPPDTKAEEAEVGVSLAVRIITVAVTGIVAEALYVVLAR